MRKALCSPSKCNVSVLGINQTREYFAFISSELHLQAIVKQGTKNRFMGNGVVGDDSEAIFEILGNCFPLHNGSGVQ